MSLSDNTYFSFPQAQSQAAESSYSSSPYSNGPDSSDFPDLFQVPSLSPDFKDFNFDQLQSLRGTSPFSYSSEFDATFGLPSGSSSGPSTAIISPKSISSDFEPVSRQNTASPTLPWNFDLAQAQAASNFHNERSIYYKNQEQEQLARAKLYNDQLAALQLFSMPVDPNANLGNVNFDPNGVPMNDASVNANMMAFQPQQAQPVSVPPPQEGMFSGMPTWQTTPSNLSPANLAEDYRVKAQQHAQAMQAFQAVQYSMSSMPTAMSNTPTYTMPTQVDMNTVSRSSSGSMSTSGATSLPTTPAAPVAVPMTTSVTAPTVVMSSSVSEGEPELDRMSVGSVVVNDDIEPTLPLGIPLINLNGGGRGYVPGQTPDDPKKRHKCNICHRGFARAYNLKAHIDTHNPVRPKPHVCPHKSCGRGFSRLHDLERHRQGIHSDGPLVDAKKQGVAPSVARAKNRIQKRAETGSLV